MNENNIKILFLEDNDDDYSLAQHSLKKNMTLAITVERASNWQKGLTLVQNNNFDVLILDYMLPDRNGLEIIELLKKENINIPIIMLTGAGDEKIAVEAMKEGVADYITKDELSTGKLSESIKKVVDFTSFLKKWDKNFIELGGFSKKRDAFTIIGLALTASCNGVHKTKLIYTTNLNSETIKKYLVFLLNNDFLSKHDLNGKEIYKTTEKGMLMLKQLHDIKKYLK
jgi:CheY-like chemotaxis protein/predicted transcriptional regulator